MNINPRVYFECRWDRPWDEFNRHFARIQGIEGSALYAALHEDPEVIDYLANQPKPSSKIKARPALFGWTALHGLVASVADQEIASRASTSNQKNPTWMPRPVLPYTAVRNKKNDSRLSAGIERAMALGQRINPRE